MTKTEISWPGVLTLALVLGAAVGAHALGATDLAYTIVGIAGGVAIPGPLLRTRVDTRPVVRP